MSPVWCEGTRMDGVDPRTTTGDPSLSLTPVHFRISPVHPGDEGSGL